MSGRSIDAAVLFVFALHWLAIVPTPGANSVLVTHVAVTRPGEHIAWVIAGNLCGILLLAVAALAGWAAVLEQFPAVRRLVYLVGGLYLVYFGLRLLNFRRSAPSHATDARNDAVTRQRTFTEGFLTAISNVQAILFITGIYATTGILNANAQTGMAAVAIVIICNASYLGLLGCLFQRPLVRLRYDQYGVLLNRVMGAIFIALGLKTLLAAAG